VTALGSLEVGKCPGASELRHYLPSALLSRKASDPWYEVKVISDTLREMYTGARNSERRLLPLSSEGV